MVGELDSIVADIEKRKVECDQRLKTLGNQIAVYFSMHLRSRRMYSADEAITALQDFFSRKGVFLGTNQLEEHYPELKGFETDYYIAKYICEKKDEGAVEYEYVIDLVKGYFLQAALYLQGKNGSVVTSTYRNVTFYYDTPFLLKLLNFKVDLDNKEANELHKSLKKQDGTFCFFPQTKREIDNILVAYKNNIGKNAGITLEGLDEKKYTPSDVDRLLTTWKANLSSTYDVKLNNRPGYAKKTDESIDEKYVIDEAGLREFLKANIKWRSNDSMEADVESLISIHQIRGDNKAEDIEHTNAIFVTTNTKLAGLFNKYYKENVDNQTFPLVITDFDLAALTWIKCGSTGQLPEKQLLRNAYMAMQPTPEMIEQFSLVLEKMQAEGRITENIAIAIRSSRYMRKEVLFSSFDGESGIDENVVKTVEAKLREDYSKEAREEERNMAVLRQKEEEHQRFEKAERMAREEACQRKKSFLHLERIVVTILGVVIIILAIIGTIESWGNSISLSACSIAFIVIALISIIDTVKGKGKIIDPLLVKWANWKYDKVYEIKKKEYCNLLCDENSKINYM